MDDYRLKPSKLWITLFNSYGYIQDLDIEELKGLNYHIKHQEYFGSLATVISLIQQQSKVHKASERILLDETLSQIVEELKHLQEDYMIIERPGKRVIE